MRRPTPDVAQFTYRGRSHVLRSPQRDHIGKVVAASKTFYEIDLLEALAALLPPTAKGIAVDVGAHIGNHALFFGAVLGLPTIAFEPNPEVFDLLTQNVRVGDSASIIALPMAAGAMSSWGYVVPGPRGNTGMTSMTAHAGEYPRPGDILTVPVDAIVPEWAHVALLKVDVEGTEIDVLRGADHVIRRDAPIITLEAREPEDFRRQCEFLEAYDYEPSQRYCKTPTYIWTQRS